MNIPPSSSNAEQGRMVPAPVNTAIPTLQVAQACGRAIAQATLAAAEAKGFDSQGAARFILGWLDRFGDVSGEDLVEAAKAHGFRGKDDRCFGGVFIGLQNRGQIECIRSDLPRKRGHGTSGGRLYRRVQGAPA